MHVIEDCNIDKNLPPAFVSICFSIYKEIQMMKESLLEDLLVTISNITHFDVCL